MGKKIPTYVLTAIVVNAILFGLFAMAVVGVLIAHSGVGELADVMFYR